MWKLPNNKQVFLVEINTLYKYRHHIISCKKTSRLTENAVPQLISGVVDVFEILTYTLRISSEPPKRLLFFFNFPPLAILASFFDWLVEVSTLQISWDIKRKIMFNRYSPILNDLSPACYCNILIYSQNFHFLI